jgi:hypothetical protein
MKLAILLCMILMFVLLSISIFSLIKSHGEFRVHHILLWITPFLVLWYQIGFLSISDTVTNITLTILTWVTVVLNTFIFIGVYIKYNFNENSEMFFGIDSTLRHTKHRL